MGCFLPKLLRFYAFGGIQVSLAGGLYPRHALTRGCVNRFSCVTIAPFGPPEKKEQPTCHGIYFASWHHREHPMPSRGYAGVSGHPPVHTGPVVPLQGRFHPVDATGVDYSCFSRHSFRIGAATTAARMGVSDSLIWTLGRWKSSAFTSYIRTPWHRLTAVSSTLAKSCLDST